MISGSYVSSIIQQLQYMINPINLCLHPPKVETSKIETEEEIGFKSLPPELILKFFQFLSISALKDANLVAKNWHVIASTEKLWKNARITIKFQTIGDLPEILNLEKFKLIRAIKFVSWLFPSNAAALLLNNNWINNMDQIVLRGNAFTELEPETLSEFLNSKKEVFLSMTRLHHFKLQISTFNTSITL